jgi:hypothetical protein
MGLDGGTAEQHSGVGNHWGKEPYPLIERDANLINLEKGQLEVPLLHWPKPPNENFQIL